MSKYNGISCQVCLYYIFWIFVYLFINSYIILPHYGNHMHGNIVLTWRFFRWNNLNPTIFQTSAKYLPNTYFYAVGKLLMLCGKTPQVFKQSWSVKTWNVHLINRHNVWCLLRSCISLVLLRTICFLSQVNNGCNNHLNLYICIFLLWRFTFSTNLAEKMYRR